jgi:hypothetical protein
MQVIHKFVLGSYDNQGFYFSQGYKILDIQPQNGAICLWVLQDVSKPPTWVNFRVFGTGWTIEVDNMDYIATVQLDALVWHVFKDK